MFTDLLDGLYVHLPLKRAMYGIDPVQQLRRLHERARLMSDDAFHREIGGILTNLRDAHTAYIAPSPLAGTAARLPFLVEQFGSEAGAAIHRLEGHPRARQRQAVRARASRSSSGTGCRSPMRFAVAARASAAGDPTARWPGRSTR